MQDLMMQQIRKYFQKNEWKFDEEQNMFSSGYALEGKIEGAFLHIAVHEKSFILLTAPDIDIPEEQFTDMRSYVNEVNNLLGIGCLYLDKEQKMLTFRTGMICADNPPTAGQIEDIFGYSCTMIQDIAEALVNLLEGKFSPEEAAVQTVQPD